MWRFRIPVWLVAFTVLVAPCFLLYAWPIESLLDTLSSLSTVKVSIASDVIANMGWWFYVPAILMAAKAAFAVLDYGERRLFGIPERYSRRRRW
jgi:hypothetical protein